MRFNCSLTDCYFWLSPLALSVSLALVLAPPKASAQATKEARTTSLRHELPTTAASTTQLRHFVAFKFKANTAPEKIKEITKAFYALKGKIPQVVAIENGANNSPEQLNKGFTHAFLVTFANEKDRDIYLTHQAHQDFKKLLFPCLEEAFVFDFSVQPKADSTR